MAPELKIILHILITQRKKHGCDNFFEFNFKEVLNELDKTGSSLKHGLVGNCECARLLDQLDNDGIIKLNHLDRIETNTVSRCVWKHKDNTRWVFDGITEQALPYTNPLQLAGKYFVYMTPDDIKHIYNTYLSDQKANTSIQTELQKHHATLSLINSQFVINCDNTEYRLPSLHQGLTYDILRCAINNPGKPLSRETLKRQYNISTNNKSLSANVFANNKQVNTILAPFIPVSADAIQIDIEKDITHAQLKVIADASIATQ